MTAEESSLGPISASQVETEMSHSLEYQIFVNEACRKAKVPPRYPDVEKHIGPEGRYTIEERVGKGGMAAVFRASDHRLKRDVALKVVKSSTQGRSEAEALAKIQHDNIVRVYDVFDVGDVGEGERVIALEYLDGETLRSWQVRQSRLTRLRAYQSAAEGLEFVHSRRIIHRDFKPDNVMVVQGNPDVRVVVVDFGLAGEVGRGEGRGHGTPVYMAPEQRDTAPTEKADQYAFCVALWEAIDGRRPFDESGESSAASRSLRVPMWLARLLRVGLQRDPSRRHADMGTLRRKLQRGLVWHLTSRSLAVALVLVAGVGEIIDTLTPDPCISRAREVDAVWSSDKSQGIREAYLERDALWAGQAETVDYAIGILDDISASWSTSARRVCEAEVQREGAPEGRDGALDARARCLDDWLEVAGNLVTQLEAGDPDAIYNIVGYEALLSEGLDECRAPRQVLDAGTQALLVEAKRRERARQFEEALALAEEADRRGRKGLGTPCRGAPDKTRETGAAALRMGHIYMAMERFDDATRHTREAVVTANACEDEVAAFEAHLLETLISAQRSDEPERVAHAWELASSALTVADGPREGSLRRVDLERARAFVAMAAGDWDDARARLESARKLLVEADNARLSLALLLKINSAQALADHMAGDFGAAAEVHNESATLLAEAIGPDHPISEEERRFVDLNLSIALFNEGRYEAAIARLEPLLAQVELDPRMQTRAMSTLIQAHTGLEQHDRGLSLAKGAQAWLEAQGELPKPSHAELLGSVGVAFLHADDPGHLSAGIDMLREAIALADPAALDSVSLRINLASALIADGQLDEAQETLNGLDRGKLAPGLRALIEEFDRQIASARAPAE